jgi:hypothetical protein
MNSIKGAALTTTFLTMLGGEVHPLPLPRLDARPYFFDAGAKGSVVARNALLLTVEDRYDPRRGYGWESNPSSSFERPRLRRSRNDLTIDGVTAMELTFRADIPPGPWWMTVWVEAGTEDSSTLQCFLNGEELKLEFQAFKPPAEPRTEIQHIYRVLNTPLHVREAGVRLQLKGNQDSVRLMGIALIPWKEASTDPHRTFLQELREAGTVHAKIPLRPLREKAERLFEQYPSDAWLAHWWNQLVLFEKAERYFTMRGWEWANDSTGIGLFSRLHQAVMLLDALLNHTVREKLPFFERALFMRGRLLYWLELERGGTSEQASAQRDLRELLHRHPNDSLVRMYNGERIFDPAPVAGFIPPPGAPEWAVKQWEVLRRLKSITHWWILRQQAPNGELGGKFGDDVEMLRFWTALILAGDTTTLLGWKRMADGIWQSPEVFEGYARHVSDVEHSSEFIADTAPNLVLYVDDSLYLERLHPSARYFRDLWTGWSHGGHRFFRSAWFSSTAIDTTPPKNRDVHYNTRATKAVRYYAWKTGEAEATRTLHEWSKAWAHAAMRTDKGKPKGILPASVRFPDEAMNGDEPTWYRANMLWDYFDWSGGASVYDQLLFTYTLTGDSALLRPLQTTLDLIRSVAPEGKMLRSEGFRMGSAEWAVARLLRSRNFWSTVGTYRRFTGDTTPDQLLTIHGTPYTKYRLTGDEKHLNEALDEILEEIRYNTPLRTTEVIHTDRVFVTVRKDRGVDQLDGMISGTDVPESASPYHAVSWLGTGDDVTIVVRESTPTSLEMMLYSFASALQRISLRVWQLEPGNYSLVVRPQKRPANTHDVQVSRRGERISLELDSNILTRIELKKRN